MKSSVPILTDGITACPILPDYSLALTTVGMADGKDSVDLHLSAFTAWVARCSLLAFPSALELAVGSGSARSRITQALVAITTVAPVNLAETHLAEAISAVVPIPEQPWLVVPDMRLAQERSGLLGQAVMQMDSLQAPGHPLHQVALCEQFPMLERRVAALHG